MLRRRPGLIAAALGAALLLGPGGTTFARDATPRTPAQGTANLLTNPGAEAGEGAPDATARPAVPGWETTATFTAVRYGAPEFPTPAESRRIGGGANFFAGGPGGAVSTATQTVDVSSRAAAIDAGREQMNLSAWLGGFASQSDAATVSAVFRGATGAELGRTVIGGGTPAERGGLTSLRPSSTTAPVPAGTRTIQAVLTAIRMQGSYNDGYIDNVSLTLGAGTPPPVAGVSVNVAPVSGVVRVRLRGTNRFVSLARLRNVPVGSELDVTRGRVRLVSAAGNRRTQTGIFYQGRAVVRQPRGRTPTTTLQVSGPLVCPRRSAAAAKPPRVRRLWGNAKGRFRTQGRFAAAVVRGTIWLTEDRCDGTLIRVRQGRVDVRDNVRNRTIRLRAGQSYLARARR
jgi:hypothetical protein